MSVSQILNEGKQAFTDKKYHKTVILCTKAIPRSKDSIENQISLLDLRCQTYTKMGKLDLALKDAKQIIHVSDRKSSLGYLRCSQLERLLENHEAATKWLEHGLKNVPRDRELFEAQLGKVVAGASKHIVLQKRRDPFEVVPLEILQSILSYLDYREVVLLLHVSKTWRNLLLKMKPLISDVDFSKQRRPASNLSYSVAFRRLSRHPQNIIIGSMSQTAEKSTSAWLTKYTNIENLETLHFVDSNVSAKSIRFDKMHKLKSLRLGVNQQIMLRDVFKIISQCKTLEEVCFDSVGPDMVMTPTTTQSHLKSLKLHNHSDQPFLFPATQFDTYPALEELSIVGGVIVSGSLDLSGSAQLRKLKLNLSAHYPCEVKLPESLEELNCDDEQHNKAGELVFVEPVNLGNLKSISLRNSWAPTAINTIGNSINVPHLRAVNLDCLPQTALVEISSQGFAALRSCEKVAFKCEQLGDPDSAAFAEIFPVVESLWLEAPQVTGVFVADLVRNHPDSRLKSIVLKDCGKVSPDTCNWLRARGIDAKLKRTIEESNGARRVCDMW